MCRVDLERLYAEFQYASSGKQADTPKTYLLGCVLLPFATAADEIEGMNISMGRSEDSRHWTWIEYELQWPRATPARVQESEKYIGIERAENIN